MGFCGCSWRSTRIFASIYSLILGSAWLGLAITGLCLYNCSIPPNAEFNGNVDTGQIHGLFNFLSQVLYLSYFANTACEDVTLPTITVEHGDNLTILTHSDNTQEPVVRTSSWMITYIVLSSLWIFTSIILLIIAVGNKKNKSIALWHYPWIIVMAANIVADVVATVIYFLDMNDMKGLDAMLRFMGYEIPEEVQVDESAVSGLTTIPSIVMGLIFARFFVLWIINAVLLIYVIMAAKDMSKEASKSAGPPHNVNSAKSGANQIVPNQPQLAAKEPVRQAPQQVQDSTAYPQERRAQSPNYAQQNQENLNSPQRRQSPNYVPSQDSFSYANGQRPFSYTQPLQPYPNPGKGVPQSQPQPLKYHQQTSMQPQHRSSPSLQQQHQQRYQYQQQGSVNPAFENDVQVARRKPPPTAPKKPYQSDPNFPSSVVRQESLDQRKRAPTELRSQLPWSYYTPPDDPVTLKQQNVRGVDEYLPPIPVPDYTLHFPKKPRPDNPLQPTSPNRDSTMTKNMNEVLY